MDQDGFMQHCLLMNWVSSHPAWSLDLRCPSTELWLLGIGRARSFVPKWRLSRVHANGYSLRLCPPVSCLHWEPEPTSTSPGDPPRPTGWSGPGFFAQGPSAQEACAPSKRGVLASPSPVEPCTQPQWPSVPNALIPPMPDLQVRKPDVVLRLTLVGV